jgi:hypothetical protein
MMKLPRKYLWQSLIGLTLGLALCASLAGHVQLNADALTGLLAKVDPFAACGALLLSVVMLETGARKWSWLDRHFDGHAPKPHRYYLRHYLWQNWLAQILPGTVALILGRALVTHVAEEKNWKRGLRSGLIDQLSELFILLAFIPATLWQLWAQGSWESWLAFGMASLLAAGWLGHRLVPRYVLPVVLFWSFLRIGAITLRLILGAQVFALAIPAAVVAYATPVATLTALLPLTPGNLGLAEWGWTYTLQLWDVPAVTGALYVLSFRILVFALQSLLLLALPILRGR